LNVGFFLTKMPELNPGTRGRALPQAAADKKPIMNFGTCACVTLLAAAACKSVHGLHGVRVVHGCPSAEEFELEMGARVEK
jgi:hypothetical protein